MTAPTATRGAAGVEARTLQARRHASDVVRDDARLAAWRSGGGPYACFVYDGHVVPFVRVGRERRTDRAQRYHASRTAVAVAMRASRNGSPPLATGGLDVTIHVLRRQRTGDTDNLAKAIIDSGNGTLWVDDKQVVSLAVVVTHGGAPGTDCVVVHYGQRGNGHAVRS